MTLHNDGQTVVVTGASSGIGRATALHFAGRGANLVLVSRSREALEDAGAACRAAGACEVRVEPADVNDESALQHVVDATVERFGRIDIVVHAAAVMAYGTVEKLPREVFERVVGTSIYGTANLARVVLPVFRRQGHGRSSSSAHCWRRSPRRPWGRTPLASGVSSA